MTKMIIMLAFFAAGLAVADIETASAASADGTQEAGEGQAFLSAKVSAVQAIQAAEAQSGGKASAVNFTAGEGNMAPFYRVEIIAADGSQQDLAVDAVSGTVKMAAAQESESDENGSGEEGQN